MHAAVTIPRVARPLQSVEFLIERPRTLQSEKPPGEQAEALHATSRTSAARPAPASSE